MTRLDNALNAIPTVDLDESAFTGTGGSAEYEEPASTDRGDVLEPTEQPVEEPKEPEAPAEEPETPVEEPKAPENEPESEKTEPEAEPEPQTNDKVNQHVPYQRFKRELEKRKAIEAELEKLKSAPREAQADVNVDYNVSIDGDKFKAMSQAFAEGNAELAQQLFSEMLGSNVSAAAKAAAKAATERAYDSARAEAEQAVQARSVIQEAQEAAEIVMAEFDIFNDKSEAFNEQLFNDAIRIRDGLLASGASVGEAILEAAELVAARNGIVAKSVAAEREAAKPKATVKAPNVKAKMEQAAKVPPKVGGEAHDAKPSIDVMNMSDAEFDQLSEADLRRLRGDFV